MTDPYERAFADAFAHIATLPRPEDLRDAAQTRSESPARETARLSSPHRAGRPRLDRAVRWLSAAAAVAVAAGLVSSALGGGDAPSVIHAEPSDRRPPVSAAAVLGFDAGPATPYAEVSVRVSRAVDQVRLEVSVEGDATAFDAVAGEFWTAEVDDHLTVALIPGFATDVLSPSEHETVRSQYLPGPDLTVVASQHAAGAAAASDLLWQDYDTEVHNSRGQIVPSGRLGVPSRLRPSRVIRVFRDDALGVWGYLDSASDNRRALPLSTAPVGSLYAVMQEFDGDFCIDCSWITMLPAGGTDPQPTIATSYQDWTGTTLGDTGQVVLMVYADKIEIGKNPVILVEYTDSAGHRSSYRPRM